MFAQGDDSELKRASRSAFIFNQYKVCLPDSMDSQDTQSRIPYEVWRNLLPIKDQCLTLIHFDGSESGLWLIVVSRMTGRR